MKTFPVEEALKAQSPLRTAAGLGPEIFPVEAFVGMISDEIETLRSQGMSDVDIADLIASNSEIEISATEIQDHYTPPHLRHS